MKKKCALFAVCLLYIVALNMSRLPLLPGQVTMQKMEEIELFMFCAALVTTTHFITDTLSVYALNFDGDVIVSAVGYLFWMDLSSFDIEISAVIAIISSMAMFVCSAVAEDVFSSPKKRT